MTPVNATVVIVFVGTPLGLRCALIQTTLPAGALKPFQETGAPDIAVPLGGITQTYGGLLEMVMVQVLVLVCATPDVESVTSAVKLNVPGVVGVPVMAPVEGFNVRPAGSAPVTMEKVYGGVPPVAAREELYGVLTVPVLAGHASASPLGAQGVIEAICGPDWNVMFAPEMNSLL